MTSVRPFLARAVRVALVGIDWWAQELQVQHTSTGAVVVGAVDGEML